MKKVRDNLLLIVFAFSMMFIFVGNVYADCPLGPDVTEDLHGVLKIFNILAPLICIAFSIIELIKAITKGDAEGESKVVAKRFGKRMIYTLLLAFTPVLVDEVMTMAGFWNENGKCDLNVYEENGASGVNGNVTTRTTAPAGDGCSGLSESQCSNNSACTFHNGACKSRCGFYDSRDCPTDTCALVSGRCVAKSSVQYNTACSSFGVSSCGASQNCTIHGGECVKKCGAMGQQECSQNSDRCQVGPNGNCYVKGTINQTSTTTTTTTAFKACNVRQLSDCSNGVNCTIYGGYCVKKCGAMGQQECSQNSNRCYVGNGGSCYSK